MSKAIQQRGHQEHTGKRFRKRKSFPQSNDGASYKYQEFLSHDHAMQYSFNGHNIIDRIWRHFILELQYGCKIFETRKWDDKPKSILKVKKRSYKIELDDEKVFLPW